MSQNYYLTEKDKVILAIEPVIKYLKERIVGVEEIWIETNSLIFRVECKEYENDAPGRYTIIPNFSEDFIKNQIEFRIKTNEGKYTPIYKIEKEIGEKFPDLKLAKNYEDRIFIRETVNFQNELNVAKQHELAENLDNVLKETVKIAKKIKI